MLARFTLVSVVLLALTVARAAEPVAYEVPKSWEKIHDGPATYPLLTARGGYAVWVDQRRGTHVTPAPRAISSIFTLYRQKEGEKEPEKLDERTTTGSLATIVGPKGEIAWGYFANADTVFLPGKKPLKLPRDAYYAARHFTADGLVCAADRFSQEKEFQSAIVLFPIDREKGELGEPRFLRKWFRTEADGVQFDFSHGKVFLRGDYVAYTGRGVRTAKVDFPKSLTEVWDVKNQKRVWRAEEEHDAADDEYVYTFRSDKGVIRRALAGDGRGKELTLPKEMVRFDFRPPKLFAIVRQDKEWLAVVLDINTGERVEYDLRVPHGQQVFTRYASGTGEVFALNSNPNDLKQSAVIGIGYDAETDTLRTHVNGAVYTVPAAKRVPAAEKPKWEPLPDKKEK
jgi:hypothetical protein